MTGDKAIKIFEHEQFGEIRIVDEKGEPWFVARDVADILGYSDTQAMTRRLDEDEVNTCTDKSSGQLRNITIINESGFYNAVIGSQGLGAVASVLFYEIVYTFGLTLL